MSRAEYMRAYRAKKRAGHEAVVDRGIARGELAFDGQVRIAELEEEVRHLKAELAKRPTEVVTLPANTTPAQYDAIRRTSQAQRDAILKAVNRGNKP